MGRRTKTLLPTTCNLLLPKIIKPSSVKSALFKQKNTQKYYYDQKSRILPPLNTGDQVKFRSGAVWLPAVVTKVSDSPRSYVITTPKGQTYRRNRRHIRPAHTTQEDEKSDSDDDTEIPTDMGEDMTWFRQQTVPVKALPVYLLAYLHCVDLHEQLHDHSVMLTHILYDSNLQKKGDVTSGSYITHITIYYNYHYIIITSSS